MWKHQTSRYFNYLICPLRKKRCDYVNFIFQILRIHTFHKEDSPPKSSIFLVLEINNSKCKIIHMNVWKKGLLLLLVMSDLTILWMRMTSRLAGRLLRCCSNLLELCCLTLYHFLKVKKKLELFLSFIFLHTLAKKSGTPHSDPSPSHQVGQIQLVNVHGKVHYLLKAKIHAVLIDLLVWLSEGLQLFRRLLSLILSLSGRNNRHLCR